MFYTIYRITNLTNGKQYIGKHQTNNLDDGYMGSGKRLRYAIAKYGMDNFRKEILFVFETEIEMNIKEAELVTEEFCLREDTYNICVGGKGGWSYINQNGLRIKGHSYEMYKKSSAKLKGRIFPHMAETMKRNHERGLVPYNNFKGKHHSEETKRKIGLANSGTKGPNGTMWITNGLENRKIKKEIDEIPKGWYKGRIT